MIYIQNPAPVGGRLLVSAAVALIPVLYFFWALAVKRMKGYLAGLSTLALAFLIAVLVYRLPTASAAMAAIQGASYGLLPIAWVIIPSVFLYKLSVKTGYFETIRASIVSITEDRRLQALLVAFSFGSFLEGAAGFGAPVAICAALLVGLGFSPLLAAGVCLVANTPPVAFGAIGIPVLAMEGPTGISALDISKMIGRQLPLLAIIIPYYFIVLMAGFQKANEVLPAVLVSGISYAAAQFAMANYFGPELPDIAAALVSLVAMTLFLRIWKPRTVFRFEGGGTVEGGAGNGAAAEWRQSPNQRGRTGIRPGVSIRAGEEGHGSPVAVGENEFPIELAEASSDGSFGGHRGGVGYNRGPDMELAAELTFESGCRSGGSLVKSSSDVGAAGGTAGHRSDLDQTASVGFSGQDNRDPSSRPSRLTPGEILRAWSPFLVLTLLVSIWGIPVVKQALTGTYMGENGLLSGINLLGHALTFHPDVPYLHNVVIGENGKPMAAQFKLELLGAAGTAIFAAVVVTKFIYRVRLGLWFQTLGETIHEMKYSILTVMSVIGFAYIANYSGISATLGHSLALTGALFPLFSPLIGWLGVFITGSDTSANLLFGNLQKVTAERVGMEPVLALAANTSGGGTAKMISPQSIAIASAAVGLNGRESELLRFTFKHSVILLVVIGVLTYLQSNVLGWMVP